MTSQQTLETIGSLMARFRAGDRHAVDELFVVLYPELRRLAALKMNNEPSGHSWQPSVLVNELYLHLVKVKSLPAAENAARSEREHFLQFAGHVMRHLLIDHSRLLVRRTTKIDIAQFEGVAEDTGTTSLQEIDDVLEKLGAIEPRLRSIVEMKVFEGLSLEEIAERLNLNQRAVARNWTFCKRWLREKLQTS
jgi:RNA polymerase sigma factor (TIGR02999 family)